MLSWSRCQDIQSRSCTATLLQEGTYKAWLGLTSGPSMGATSKGAAVVRQLATTGQRMIKEIVVWAGKQGALQADPSFMDSGGMVRATCAPLVRRSLLT
eukprot:12711160-Prorocentrum_lima.AAC.1